MDAPVLEKENKEEQRGGDQVSPSSRTNGRGEMGRAERAGSTHLSLKEVGRVMMMEVGEV